MRVNYTIDQAERALINKAIYDRQSALILQYFADDSMIGARTPWGPDALVKITVPKYGSNGMSIVGKGSVIVTVLEGSEDELPPMTNWLEWKNMVLEGVASVCSASYRTSTWQMSADMIEKLKHYKPQKESPDNTLTTNPRSAGHTPTTVSSIFNNPLINGNRPSTVTDSPVCITQSMINSTNSPEESMYYQNTHHVMITTHSGDSPYPRNNQRRNGPYNKKVLKMKEGDELQLTLAEIANSPKIVEKAFKINEVSQTSVGATEISPTAKPNLLKRIISLFKRG